MFVTVNYLLIEGFDINMFYFNILVINIYLTYTITYV